MRLRRSIAIPFVGMLVLLVISTLVTSYRISSQSLLNGLEKKERQRLLSIHLNIETIIAHHAEEVSELSALIAATSSARAIVAKPVRPNSPSMKSAFDEIENLLGALLTNSFGQITDQTGKLLYSTNQHEETRYSEHLWGLTEALAGQQQLVAEKVQQHWDLRAFAPVWIAGKVMGAVIVGMPLDNSFARGIAAATDTRIQLLTWNGSIASTIEGPLPQDIDISSAWRSTVMEGGAPIFSHNRPKRKAFLYAPLHLGDETFCVVIQGDTSDLFSLLATEKRRLLHALAWLSLIIIGIGGLTFFLTLRPLIHLRRRVVQLGLKYGQPEQESIATGNEITSLISTFSMMEDAITQHSEQLQESELLRRKLEKENRQAQKMRAMGTLAGGIAHDFNNILTAILGFTELAHDSLSIDSPEKTHLEKVLIASHRARSLTRQILLFSRQSNEECTPIDLSQTISETSDLIRASLPTTISIVTDLSANAGYVLTNATEMHQLVMNLCTNAQHAMEKTGGTLNISLGATKISASDPDPPAGLPAGNYVELIISDTGCGMDPQTKERIFDPYFTTRSLDDGTGLGLAVVHGVVNSCNGGILVESQVGKGTSFRILLPRHQMIVDSDTRQPCEKADGTECILFVDDEEAILHYARTALGALGYQVDIATNSVTAHKLFSASPKKYALVITDQTMPDGTGLDLAQRLQHICPGIPLIICSGNTQTIDRSLAEKRGVKKIISKPFSAHKIAMAIRAILDPAPN